MISKEGKLRKSRRLLRILNSWFLALSGRVMHRSIVFIHDLIVLFLTSVVVVLAVELLQPVGFNHDPRWSYLFASLIVSFISIYIFKVYKGIIRLSGYREIMILCKASLFKGLSLSVIYLLVEALFFSMKMSSLLYQVLYVLAAEFLISFSLLVLSRMLMVCLYRLIMGPIKDRQRATILFSDMTVDNGFLEGYNMEGKRAFTVVAYASLKKSSSDYRVDGKKVHYIESKDYLMRIMEKERCRALIFADDQAFRSLDRDSLSALIDNGIEVLVRRVPAPISENNGSQKIRKPAVLHSVHIEDLLVRGEIEIDMQPIRSEIEGRVVLVTGAAGSIGSELVRQLAEMNPKELVLFDFSETALHNLRLELAERYPELVFYPIIGDMRFERRLDYVFRKYHPSFVFHAAAYKHVPLMEENPCEAILSIVRGSRQVADFCIKYDVEKMVMVSTDKAVNPSSVMGAAKRIAEMYVQGLDMAIKSGRRKGKTRFVTTRFGNVLGSNGSVIPRFQEQILNGGPVTVTHPKIERYFMTIPEACRLVLEAGVLGLGGEIFVFDMGDAVRIDDMARRTIRLAGLVPDVDIKIVYTGLRPGEKLYEELLSNEEKTIPTNMRKVFLAKVRAVDIDEVSRDIASLEALSEEVDVERTIWQMKAMVPEYKSLNSTFEKYNKVSTQGI